MPGAEINGASLSWREAGAGERVLLLVHGFPLSSAMWEPQLEAPPPGWRLVAPDLRGFGESRPVPDQLTMDMAAADLAGLLRHLGVPGAVVCGLSMGGYITFAMLRNHPELVRGMVLCDTRAEPDTAEARAGRLEKAAAVREKGTEAMMADMLPALLSPFTMSKRPAIVESVRSQLAEATPAAVVAALHGMAARPDSTPLLRSINIPTQVLAGADDSITPAGEARVMARAIPGARFDTVEDAGHLSNLENPFDFNAFLKTFLAGFP
ncbi:MAG TPA: alpha/beta fold hydrolase [Longimicrobiales bacterium]|nr:alpha/beta fold hydrolase [Longimicrobiales bacterium]